MAVDYDKLRADIAANSNLTQSVVQALQAQKKIIADMGAQLAANGDISAAGKSTMDQCLADLEKNNASLSAAVLAGTTAVGAGPDAASVRNDGTNQNGDQTGLVPATSGASTSGITGPGADQAPAPATGSSLTADEASSKGDSPEAPAEVGPDGAGQDGSDESSGKVSKDK